MIVCRALGPVELDVDGVRLASGRSLFRKNIALLTYLGRAPGLSRTRIQLVGLLWADKEEQPARQSLRQALTDLKRDLGDSLLTSSNIEVALNPGAVEFDFDRFEEHRQAARWGEAAELCRGEFLEGVAVSGSSEFEDWVSAERGLWRRRTLEILLAWGEDRLSTGEIAEAADVASRAVVSDPHADAAVQLLMRCFALEGNPAAALTALDDFRLRLSEIGFEPNESTCRLAATVTERLPPARAQMGGADRPSRRLPMVGREEELRVALTTLRAAIREGHAGILMVGGDQGTGKSRFAEEIIGHAALEGATVAKIRAVEGDEQTPWSGVAGLLAGGLADAPGLAGADPKDLASLASVSPDLHERFPSSATANPDVSGALRRTIRALCEEQPTVLCFDDAHFLDAETLGLVHAVVRDLEGFPLAVVAVHSNHHSRVEIEDMRARIGRDIAGHDVLLPSLSETSIRTLASKAMPACDDAQIDRLARRVSADTGNIPLLATELLNAVAIGLAPDGEGARGWPQSGRTLDQTAPGDLPHAISGAIRASFWRAPAIARTVLQALACVGENRRVTPGTLARVTESSVTEVTEALDWLEWERWVVSEPRGYAFVARIVSDVIRTELVVAGQRERFRELAQ